MTEYETCYIYTTDETDEPIGTSSKRRKTIDATETAEDTLGIHFVPLLRGRESRDNVEIRARLFCDAWSGKEKLIDVKALYQARLARASYIDTAQETIRLANEDTVRQIVSFVTVGDNEALNDQIPTGLIVAGPGDTAALDFTSISEHADLEKRSILIQLTSGPNPNVKTVLKTMNQHVSSQALMNDEEISHGHRSSRLLNYDLQILQNYVNSYKIRKVILAFQDSEAFEGSLLADLIEVLSSWNDRIPFVLLFSIATSIELFQSKLPRETVRRLSGSSFHVKQIDVQQIFQIIHHEESALFFGSGLSSQILEQNRDFIQSFSAFAGTLRYAYMTHFFANPLSILQSDSPTKARLQVGHYEAIRNLPSFRKYARALINKQEYHTVKSILDDDESLHSAVETELVKSREVIKDLLLSLKALCQIQSRAASKNIDSWTEMYIQAMSNSLIESASFEDILASIKKLSSDALNDLLEDLIETLSSSDAVTELQEIRDDLNQLTTSLTDSTTPLRSAYDIHHSTLRTTVVAQKVSLSKNSSKLSTEDNTYTKIVDRVFDTLSNHFRTTLINPSDLFLHEVLIYDAKSPHREVFTAKPRFAIERALSSPHDYLGCECCSAGEGAGLEALQPATAVLYQLYLESGSIINTADLWEAFWTIVGAEGGEDEEGEKERALALFSRSLAELRYMGMIKGSRKKADHLAKLAWKGL